MLHQPQLLILDEATSALDREHQQVILEALKTLHGQMTVLIVTHRFEEIRDLLDGVVRVEDGRVGYWNPVGENADQKAKPLASDASAKQPTTVN